MKYLISALEKMMKEEKEGAKRYRQLANLLVDVDLPDLGNDVYWMAGDEEVHSKKLSGIVKTLKKEFAGRFKGR